MVSNASKKKAAAVMAATSSKAADKVANGITDMQISDRTYTSRDIRSLPTPPYLMATSSPSPAFVPYFHPTQLSDFKVLKATKVEFPALDGQSVSCAILEFPGGGSINPSQTPFCRDVVHFLHNADPQKTAFAISAFGSASAGTVSIPSTLFNTTIDDNVLALAFKTDVATIQTLKKGFAPKA
ncbi:hypothetical protein JHK85_057037 [Glycine max]|nr:hypothetical protein JHK85_057037 [Glycine max]